MIEGISFFCSVTYNYKYNKSPKMYEGFEDVSYACGRYAPGVREIKTTSGRTGQLLIRPIS